MKKLLLVTAALFGFTGAAHAQSFHFGVQGGYDWANSDVNIPAYTDPNVSIDGDGWQLGAFGGVDWQMGSGWTLGVEADANWTDAEAEGLSGGSGGETFTVSENWNAGIRGRVAFDISTNDQLYGALGWSWADVDANYSGGSDEGATLSGWTAAVGLDHNFGSWFGRVEYRHSDYDSEHFDSLFASADLTNDALLLGAGWKM